MFKIVAFLFAVTAGVPAEEPAGRLVFNLQTFDTLQACLEFGDTEEGRAVRHAVDSMVEQRNGAIMAKVGCQKIEDNSI